MDHYNSSLNVPQVSKNVLMQSSFRSFHSMLTRPRNLCAVWHRLFGTSSIFCNLLPSHQITNPGIEDGPEQWEEEEEEEGTWLERLDQVTWQVACKNVSKEMSTHKRSLPGKDLLSLEGVSNEEVEWDRLLGLQNEGWTSQITLQLLVSWPLGSVALICGGNY